MRRVSILLVAVVAAIIGGCGGTTQHSTKPTASTPCALVGSGVTAAPERQCTPGMWISDPAIKATPAASEYDPNISDEHVCSQGYNPRPGVNISGPLKKEALAQYGLPESVGATSEADHLYPRWLGGATTLANFWPEPNYAHPSGFSNNPKDELEYKLYQLTCEQHSMTVAEARTVFEGDWRTAYEQYVRSPIPQEPGASSAPASITRGDR
jgi:hypothetical protein